ncbi:hypothetical protein GE21DRAFT_9889 [Neurospora crassa]|uniref:Uncharacterized protein n=1 Tax=Neurospora crassa (strain ATCC 24698 / 74-OR23-1A / CBS 708.71 / DSM 1257 / FGSC 987) TaxID=367110 RepID=Q7S4M2_NEUCR|nr:hypothetical protein NCU09578 [Neurospora crassa OR74A]EAA30453.1 hypothetical protein NCU09578 [Neurospora crassa OR74A]KHE81544.1 hypothetical protein GE21DRAFT_9889 [Neurospora crassa]|eukprot:XP_959689.1 hypothetical protein NCU09578 [Neurospora crassa OR74A]
MTRHHKKPCPHKRLYEAAQQRRRQREQEAVEALMLLRAGFGEFGLWGNVPGNVPGTLPLQWQSNWQPFPGSRPVSFGPVAVGGSNPQTTNPTTTTTTTTSAANTSTRGTIPNGRPTTSSARLNTLAAVAANSRPLPSSLGQASNRPSQDRANGSTSARETTRARSRAPSPEGPRRSQAPSPEGQRRSPAPSPEDPGYRGSSRQ